ncbi:MAG TPA: DUF1861 family protein [Thermoclostridium sp.]
MSSIIRAQSCSELLKNFEKTQFTAKGEKIKFINVGDRDVYNITAPFDIDGKRIIAGRVEKRDSEFSQVMFFAHNGEAWTPIDGAPVFDLQDPFITRINNEIVFGGVDVFPKEDAPGQLQWRTFFFKGKTINDLKHFAKGPIGMKDIRLVELSDRRIGVFTRPQGIIGGRGKIGFTSIGSLDELTEETIIKAELIENQFLDDEWGGSNEPHLLKNGKIGVLGHIACFDEEGNRHYYSMVFMFDPVSKVSSPIQIIATRSNFEKGEYKRKDLMDVIFSGGLIRREDGFAELYVGVSDAEAHKIIIPDPFLQFE